MPKHCKFCNECMDNPKINFTLCSICDKVICSQCRIKSKTFLVCCKKNLAQQDYGNCDLCSDVFTRPCRYYLCVSCGKKICPNCPSEYIGKFGHMIDEELDEYDWMCNKCIEPYKNKKPIPLPTVS